MRGHGCAEALSLVILVVGPDRAADWYDDHPANRCERGALPGWDSPFPILGWNDAFVSGGLCLWEEIERTPVSNRKTAYVRI